MWIYLALAILAVALFAIKKKKSLKVINIIIYPIRFCAGAHLKTAQITDYGFLFDCEWVLITPNNKIVTNQDDQRISLLESFLHTRVNHIIALDLIYKNLKLSIEPQKVGEIISFISTNSIQEGIDEGSKASEFLKTIFKKDYRLIRVIKSPYETKNANGARAKDNQNAQFLMTSQAKSEQNCNLDGGDLLGFGYCAVVVIEGSAFKDKSWAKVRIGDVVAERVENEKAQGSMRRFVCINNGEIRIGHLVDLQKA